MVGTILTTEIVRSHTMQSIFLNILKYTFERENNMEKLILAINPGSTSTKVALFMGTEELQNESVEHPTEQIQSSPSVASQYTFRLEAILALLDKWGLDKSRLSAVVGRGGLLPPIKAGGYRVNEAMLNRLQNPIAEHASNLGGIIAYNIAEPLGLPAFIYDAVTSDELDDIARVTGLLDIKKRSMSHVLNTKAVARQYAESIKRTYGDMRLVVAHLGGGISVSAHRLGKLVDTTSDDIGAMSPERSGSAPLMDVVKLCFSGKYTEKELLKHIRGNGGLKNLLGTHDCREVERRIAGGDSYAALVYGAMAYQIAKCIAEMSVALSGNVDAIILTGGVAYSDVLTEMIQERVKFIAPVVRIPGENEMYSLACGALRIVEGKEEVHTYSE